MASAARGPTTTAFVCRLAAQRVQRLARRDAETAALARREAPEAGVRGRARVPCLVHDRPVRAPRARAARGSRGSRRRRGSTPPGSRRGRAASSPARAASARVSSLPCSPSGNQSRSRKRGSSRASMYDWSFARRSRARAADGRRARRCARSGRSRAAAAPARSAKASSSAKRKLPLQRMHGFGVSPARVARARTARRRRARNSSRRSSVTCGSPRPVAGRARGEHGLRRAAGALGVRALRVEPEAQRRRRSRRARPAEARPRCRRRRSSRRPRGPASARRGRPGASAFASASTASSSPPTAAASSSVRPASRRSSPSALRRSTIRSPSTASRTSAQRPSRVESPTTLDHRQASVHAARKAGDRRSPRLAPPCRCLPRPCEPGQARWVPRLPSARASGRTRLPLIGVGSTGAPEATHRVEWSHCSLAPALPREDASGSRWTPSTPSSSASSASGRTCGPGRRGGGRSRGVRICGLSL